MGAYVIDLNDIRVRQPRVDLRFLQEALTEVIVGGVLRGHHLQGYQASEFLLHGLINARHSAATYLPLYFETRELH